MCDTRCLDMYDDGVDTRTCSIGVNPPARTRGAPRPAISLASPDSAPCPSCSWLLRVAFISSDLLLLYGALTHVRIRKTQTLGHVRCRQRCARGTDPAPRAAATCDVRHPHMNEGSPLQESTIVHCTVPGGVIPLLARSAPSRGARAPHRATSSLRARHCKAAGSPARLLTFAACTHHAYGKG